LKKCRQTSISNDKKNRPQNFSYLIFSDSVKNTCLSFRLPSKQIHSVDKTSINTFKITTRQYVTVTWIKIALEQLQLNQLRMCVLPMMRRALPILNKASLILSRTRTRTRTRTHALTRARTHTLIFLAIIRTSSRLILISQLDIQSRTSCSASITNLYFSAFFCFVLFVFTFKSFPSIQIPRHFLLFRFPSTLLTVYNSSVMYGRLPPLISPFVFLFLSFIFFSSIFSFSF
jgi:hypothetical protein